MFVGWDQTVITGWFQIHIRNESSLNLKGSNDFVFAFFDELVAFVILSLTHGSFFDGGRFVLLDWVESVSFAELWVFVFCLLTKEGVNVSSHNEVIVRKLTFQFFQGSDHLVNLWFIFFFP